MRNQKEEKRIKNEHINSLLGKEAPDSWVIFPRYLLSLQRAGVISPTEFSIYAYLRAGCNQYGIRITSVEDIMNDCFPRNKKPTKNWINKILRSLLSKRLIDYNERKGVTGSFEITFEDFLLPNGIYSRFNAESKNDMITGGSLDMGVGKDEDIVDVSIISPTLKHQTTLDNTSNYGSRDRGEVPGTNTDMNNDIDTNTVSVSYKKMGKIPLEGFSPRKYSESVALEIAKYVGDTHMDWYLSLINNGHFWALEKSFGELKEAKTESVDNPGAYLNSIVQRLIIQRGRKEVGKNVV